MENQLWGVLLGAAAAGFVPLLTLRANQSQWRLDKRIELLSRKKTDLEQMYAEIFEQLSKALQDNSYPISMMSKISVRASQDVRKLYYDYMESKERDPTKKKHFLLELSIATNRHITSVEQEIENLLK